MAAAITSSVYTLHKYRSIRSERMHQIRQVLSFYHANLFHAGNRVIPYRQRSSLDSAKPALEPRKIQWVLLARVD
jgi:hypothetical protein